MWKKSKIVIVFFISSSLEALKTEKEKKGGALNFIGSFSSSCLLSTETKGKKQKKEQIVVWWFFLGCWKCRRWSSLPSSLLLWKKGGAAVCILFPLLFFGEDFFNSEFCHISEHGDIYLYCALSSSSSLWRKELMLWVSFIFLKLLKKIFIIFF